MSDMREQYEHLVCEEDALHSEIKTCQIVVDTILSAVHKEAGCLNILIAEEILEFVHQLEVNARTDILHLRLEKSKLAYEIEHIEVI